MLKREPAFERELDPGVHPEQERARILAVDDEPRSRLLVRRALERDFDVLEARDGCEAVRALAQHHPDLIVLDATMPRMEGFETLRRIREQVEVLIIMLTALGDEAQVVRALDGGADAYVTKPIGSGVLAACVRAVLRRARTVPGDDAALLRFDGGRLVIDRSAQRVRVGDREVDLSRTEYRLLICLVERAGQVVSPAEILHDVWGPEYKDAVGYIKSYIRLLRTKLEDDSRTPRYIVSRRGLGYMLTSPAGSRSRPLCDPPKD